MSSLSRAGWFVTVLLSIFLSIPFAVIAEEEPSENKISVPSSEGGLVIQCDWTECSFEHIKQLGARVMRYLIWFATFGLIIFIFYVGLRFATNTLRGGDGEAAWREVQQKIPYAVGGLVLVLASWLLVEFLFVDVLQYTGGNPLEE